MQINRESIQVHARERLEAPELTENPEGQIEAFRRFLRLETERLRMRHRFGLGGSEIATGRSYQVDMVVTRVCQVAASRAEREAQRALQQCAVVALGGYGRGELAPYSDVDLLFLHPGKPAPAVARFVEQALQMLWDAGLTVGHSFRSPKECVAEAKDDLVSRTSLTEARLVTGSDALYQTLLRQLETDLLGSRRATESFLESMRVELAERAAKVAGAVCVLEPNVKEGMGGLRDLHAILWVGYARYGARGLAALRTEGYLSEREYVAARRAYDFLARVRNEAHFTTGRKTDLFTLDMQPELARNLGYKPKAGLFDSEIFMRDYYRRASELHDVSRGFMLAHLQPAPRRSFFGLRRPRSTKGFAVKDGQLHARGVELKGGPNQVLEAFANAQEGGLLLSEELKRALRDRAETIDRAFRSSRDASRAFLRLLARRGRVGATLRGMHETGVLGRLLPEWARITFLVQHDFFHKYTVDEHTLKAIEALDEVAAGSDPALARLGKAFDEVQDAAPLYLGMLLHDIGKGRGDGHVVRGLKIGAGILTRLKVEPAAAEDVLFLIGAHLEMSQLSQQRDLSEPGLAEAFAARVGTLDRLNLLFLLTYADHRAVGPGIWNEWKASLLWELYNRTRPHLAGGERRSERERDQRVRELAVNGLLDEFPGDEVQRHFAMLPERYLRTTGADRMVRHFRLLRSLGEHPAAVEWGDLPERHCSELTVTARDRPGLFASLAGTLSAHGIDILSVDLFNRDDGLVIDTFLVAEVSGHRPVDSERRTRIARDLREAAAGRFDVARAVEKWRGQGPRRPKRHWGRGHREPVVRFDSEGSATATIVEVRAPDQPGIAYTIADALAHLGLDITFAQVATAKALALNVFYVTDESGRKLSPESMSEVEAALLAALGPKSRTRISEKEAG